MADYYVKCLSCGKTKLASDGGNIPCRICGQKRWVDVCAGCYESIENQDVKDCRGLAVHARQSCWNKCWNK